MLHALRSSSTGWLERPRVLAYVERPKPSSSPAGSSTSSTNVLHERTNKHVPAASSSVKRKAEQALGDDDEADGLDLEQQSYWAQRFAATSPQQLAELNIECELGLEAEELASANWVPLTALAQAYAQMPPHDRAKLAKLVSKTVPAREEWRKVHADLCDGKEVDIAKAYRLVRGMANFTMLLAQTVERALYDAFPECHFLGTMRDFIVLSQVQEWRSVVNDELLSSAGSTSPWPSLFHLLPAKVFNQMYDGNSPVYNTDFLTPIEWDELCKGDDVLMCLVSAILGEDKCENDHRASTFRGRSRRRDSQLMDLSQPFSSMKAYRIATCQWFAMNRDEHTQFANCSANARDARRRERMAHAIVLPRVLDNGCLCLELAASPEECYAQRKEVAIPLELSEQAVGHFKAKAIELTSEEEAAAALTAGQVVVVVNLQALNIAAMLLRPSHALSHHAWEALLATTIFCRMVQHSRQYDPQTSKPFSEQPLAAALVHALVSTEQSVKARVLAAARGLP